MEAHSRDWGTCRKCSKELQSIVFDDKNAGMKQPNHAAFSKEQFPIITPPPDTAV